MHTTARNVSAQLNDDNEPRLGVESSLAALFPLKLRAFNTSHVLFYSLYSLSTILLAHEPSCHGNVGQQEEEANRLSHSAAAKDEKHSLCKKKPSDT